MQTDDGTGGIGSTGRAAVTVAKMTAKLRLPDEDAYYFSPAFIPRLVLSIETLMTTLVIP